MINCYSYRKYILQTEKKTYNDLDYLEYIEWYDGDYDINRREENVKIEQIGENLLQISSDKNGCLADIWICDIIDIK